MSDALHVIELRADARWTDEDMRALLDIICSYRFSRGYTGAPGELWLLFNIDRHRHAYLMLDGEGELLAMLSERSTDAEAEAETWIVKPGKLADAVRRIREFLE